MADEKPPVTWRDRARRLWQQFTTPSASVVGVEDRQRAQLLATLLLAFIAVCIGILLALDLPLPPDEDVLILAVEVQDVDTFGEGCTDGVEAAIPAVASKLVEEVLATRDESCISAQQASCSAQPARPWGTGRPNTPWNARTTLN